MSRVTWGGALALLLCISLVASAPARLLRLVLPGEQVLMQGFGGTVWRGSASRCLVRAGSGYLHLGTLRWSLDPLSLLLLAPRLTLSSAWGSQVIAGEVVLRGLHDIELYDFEALVAADLLRQFAPVSLSGALSVQLDELRLRDGLPYSGGGRLVWQEGGWQSPRGLIPLGTYAVDVEQAPDALLGQVVTVTGPVEATGTVQLQGREYQGDILVSGSAPLDDQLEQALSLIAAPGPQGYRVVLNGEF